MSALQRDVHYAIATNPQQSEGARERAWIQYELDCWWEAHVLRGLSIDDCPREYRTALFDRERQRQLSKIRT